MWLSNLVAKQIHIFLICGIESLPSNIGAMNIIKEVGEVSYSLKLNNHSPHYVAIADCHPNLNLNLKPL
jgi:hypothetical protein